MSTKLRVFKNRWFNKFCKKEHINDIDLQNMIRDIMSGNIDADYGGFVIKQRLARKNEGKSGGYRTIILYRMDDKAFFVYGFAKKDKHNITKEEEHLFKELAKEMLSYDDNILNKLSADGMLIEVKDDQ